MNLFNSYNTLSQEDIESRVTRFIEAANYYEREEPNTPLKLERDDNFDQRKIVYIEPFVGSGEYLLNLLSKLDDNTIKRYERIILCSSDIKIITVYRTVIIQTESVIEVLTNLNKQYNTCKDKAAFTEKLKENYYIFKEYLKTKTSSLEECCNKYIIKNKLIKNIKDVMPPIYVIITCMFLFINNNCEVARLIPLIKMFKSKIILIGYNNIDFVCDSYLNLPRKYLEYFKSAQSDDQESKLYRLRTSRLIQFFINPWTVHYNTSAYKSYSAEPKEQQMIWWFYRWIFDNHIDFPNRWCYNTTVMVDLIVSYLVWNQYWLHNVETIPEYKQLACMYVAECMCNAHSSGREPFIIDPDSATKDYMLYDDDELPKQLIYCDEEYECIAMCDQYCGRKETMDPHKLYGSEYDSETTYILTYDFTGWHVPM